MLLNDPTQAKAAPDDKVLSSSNVSSAKTKKSWSEESDHEKERNEKEARIQIHQC